jgi:hypothetical protein
MKANPVMALALALASNGWAATYTYTGATYTTVGDYSSCAIGPCANYSSAMRVSGSFTTATPLAANLADADVTGQVSSFTFSDGINTLASTDASVRKFYIYATTDGAGQLTAATVSLQRWLSGSSPHSTGDRVSWVLIWSGGVTGYHNYPCSTVATSPGGTADSCTVAFADASSSDSGAGTGDWLSQAAVPTLSQWGLVALAALLGACGWRVARQARA